MTRIASTLADGHRQRDEFLAAMGESVKRDPYNFETHLMAVTFLCEKWYLGSTTAYGYFWMRQTEGFHAVWKWAN
ncbi:hypothetical protein [Micromonospora sp. NPDC092111]|uniref:hypothetical protein n=1 Tax=Micromonospora sp. NPDC092111 TaxID=3364289 RepID=UPI0038102B54